MTPVFTDDELKSFTIEQLRNVCSYLNIPTNSKWKKQEYLIAVKNHPGIQNTDPQTQYFLGDAEVPRYSVRLLKILENNGGRIP